MSLKCCCCCADIINESTRVVIFVPLKMYFPSSNRFSFVAYCKARQNSVSPSSSCFSSAGNDSDDDIDNAINRCDSIVVVVVVIVVVAVVAAAAAKAQLNANKLLLSQEHSFPKRIVST